MKLCATFPGKFGDILWALPTIRAISETYQAPVDLQIAGEFKVIISLLTDPDVAPYLGKVWAEDRWVHQPPEEWNPPNADALWARYESVFHLGYRGWPQRPLAQEIYQYAGNGIRPLDLDRPWLTPPRSAYERDLTMAWSDYYFELKYGLSCLIERWFGSFMSSTSILGIASPSDRWENEALWLSCSWLNAARVLNGSKLVLTDCSAYHVLARALGKPVLLVEPMEARWNDIFYPYGKSGHGVELLLGNDGRPTFDARHCKDKLEELLKGGKK